MFFTLPYTKVVATKVGHTIEFIAGQPTHVPKEAWPEVQAVGAQPSDHAAVLAAQATKKQAVVVDDPVERKQKIFDAFTTLIERNARGDFGASNQPHQKALEKLVGFDVDPKERDTLWSEFTQLSTDGEAQADAALIKAAQAREEARMADADAHRAQEAASEQREAKEAEETVEKVPKKRGRKPGKRK